MSTRAARGTTVFAAAVLVTAISGGAALAGAGPNRDAMMELHNLGADALKYGDNPAAQRFWHRASDMGHSDSSFYLGRIYDRGLAAKQDFAEAAKYYLRASAQGSIFAEPKLGRLYAGGFGVERNPVEAQRWFRRAATWLVRPPEYAIDLRLASGSIAYEPVPQGFKDALAWMGGVRTWTPGRQYRESVRYRLGDGVPQDDVLAQRLLGIAAEGGLARAQHEFGVALLGGDAAPLLSGEDCEAVTESGLSWLHQAGSNGYSDAFGALGAQYANTANAGANDWKAYYWLIRAQRNGLDVDAVMASVEARVSRADKAAAQRHLADGSIPELY